MLLDFPRIQVPEVMTRICELSLKNNRNSVSEVTKIIEKDTFLNLYFKNNFKKELDKGSLNTLITGMGWDGFRNKVAELYVQHARYSKYTKIQNIDEAHDIIDLEKRFDFMYPEGNSRIFLLGLYLKLSDIHMENSFDYAGESFMAIPPEVDEILILSKGRSIYPDWLLLTIWTMVSILGKDRTQSILKDTKGDLKSIMSLMSTDENEAIFRVLLRYSYGIADVDFLTATRV